MKAAQIDRPGSPGLIELVYVPAPRDPGPTEVVVEVARMGINGADLKTLAPGPSGRAGRGTSQRES